MNGIVAFVIAGFILGLLDVAVFFPEPLPGAAAVLMTTSLACLPALGIGLSAELAVRLFRRTGLVRKAKRRLVDLVTHDPGAQRSSFIWVDASISSLVAVIAIATLAGRYYYGALLELQERSLALDLATLGTAALALGAILGVLTLGGLTALALRVLERRRRLPLPRSVAIRLFLFGTLPVFIVVVPLLARHREALGRTSDALAVVLVLILGLQLTLATAALTARRRLGVLLSATLLAMVASGALATSVLYERRPLAAASVEDAVFASLGARFARWASDFDGDGVASILGQRDCKPFNRKISPALVDIPDNGVDENCDGVDAKTISVASDLVRVSGKLPSEAVRPYNVVWIIIDAVRADSVGFLGYPEPITPNLDELAKESLVFSSAYSQSSATLLSFPSMFTGKVPSSLKWQARRGKAQPTSDSVTIAERLRKKGYNTALLLTSYTKQRFIGVQQGYDRVEALEPDEKNWEEYTERRSPYAAFKAIRFLERAAGEDRPFFLTVYFPDPHFPYERQQGYGLPEFEDTRRGHYLSEIAYTDRYIGTLTDYIRTTGSLWQNTVLVVVADHGEEFDEHGHNYHATSCYEESTHVPLIVRIPGIASQTIQQRVALIDIAPTLLELIDEKREGVEAMQGQSLLVPALAPNLVQDDRPVYCDVVSQTSRQRPFYRRSVRAGNLALMIQTVPTRKLELYDLDEDPLETKPLELNRKRRAQSRRLANLLNAVRTGNLSETTGL